VFLLSSQLLLPWVVIPESAPLKNPAEFWGAFFGSEFFFCLCGDEVEDVAATANKSLVEISFLKKKWLNYSKPLVLPRCHC